MLIGSISAHIPGDLRYFDTLTVELLDDGCFAVRLKMNGAAGGMDTLDGGSTTYARDIYTAPSGSSASQLVKLIKRVSDSKSKHCLKRYGKLSKRFQWYDDDKTMGLSVKNCQKVLDEVQNFDV